MRIGRLDPRRIEHAGVGSGRDGGILLVVGHQYLDETCQSRQKIIPKDPEDAY